MLGMTNWKKDQWLWHYRQRHNYWGHLEWVEKHLSLADQLLNHSNRLIRLFLVLGNFGLCILSIK